MNAEEMCESYIHKAYCMGAFRKDHWCGNWRNGGETMICPKCEKVVDRLLAISRVDNKTMICDECGTIEALDAAGLTEGSSVRESILESIHRKQEDLE